MNKGIKISFDESINSYIIKFPDLVELGALKKAKTDFNKLLTKNSQRHKFSLLFDTGAHEFESIECLKYVRTFLSIQPLIENCHKFASVVPESFTKAEVKSDKEASFNNYSEAYCWLSQNL